MNKSVFYKLLKNTSAFGLKLLNENVEGMEALLDGFVKHSVLDLHHKANMLAQTHHETGGYMFPIKETVMPHHVDKNPSDTMVISRLDVAWAKGQLPWVKTAYWRDGWFGRGMVQITHEANYKKVGAAIGIDLAADPDKALVPSVSADIVIVGMTKGLFTGKKLSDFKFPGALSSPELKNPRRIINGKDGTDAKVAKIHKVFYTALEGASK